MAGHNARSGGMGMIGGALPGWVHYQDPTAPRFIEDRSPIRCHLCGNVPRYSKLLDENAECRGRLACASRQKDSA